MSEKEKKSKEAFEELEDYMINIIDYSGEDELPYSKCKIVLAVEIYNDELYNLSSVQESIGAADLKGSNDIKDISKEISRIKKLFIEALKFVRDPYGIDNYG
ncbi:hypothetical protein LCGC14_0603250 [marine sediment metagenome]|uniref:Uncharacterized protein n=1 Tax=marine sediment metagenome TaxID=412755 RepID=A0A0F9RA44_9ZZZZ